MSASLIDFKSDRTSFADASGEKLGVMVIKFNLL